MKQILCVQEAKFIINGGEKENVKKGEVYTPVWTGHVPNPINPNNIYHRLKERLYDNAYNVELFIDLPDQEGVVFSKKVEKHELV